MSSHDPWRSVARLALVEGEGALLDTASSVLGAVLGASRIYMEIGRRDTVPLACRMVGFDGANATEIRHALSHGIIAKTLAEGRPVCTTNAMADGRFSGRRSIVEGGIEAVLCCPVPDPPGGVVWVERPTAAGEFSPQDIEVTAIVAALLGSAVGKSLGGVTRPSRPRPALDLGDLVAESPAMLAVLDQLALVAHLDVDLLLTGPTGSGKTELARLVTRNSRRAARPFVDLNCGAFPDTLVESELFGSRPGSHSAAIRPVPGKLDAAAGGTLLLDEVAEFSLASQVKLLQVLQDRVYWPLGSTSPVKADVRILAATHADLEARVRDGLFREDLYWRLAVFPVEVPGLDRRQEDIVPLAERFARAACKKHGIKPIPLSGTAATWLESTDWPGHVRQLQHAVDRAVIVAQGDAALKPSHFAAPTSATGSTRFDDLVEAYQRILLVRAMRQAGFHAEKAANALGLGRSTFYKHLRKFGLGNLRATRDDA